MISKSYTSAEAQHAKIVLGLRDEYGKNIPIADRSNEGLRNTIALINNRMQDMMVAHRAAEKVLLDRLKTTRQAKAKANQRADRAEAAMRAMLDQFKQTEVK